MPCACRYPGPTNTPRASWRHTGTSPWWSASGDPAGPGGTRRMYSGDLATDPPGPGAGRVSRGYLESRSATPTLPPRVVQDEGHACTLSHAKIFARKPTGMHPSNREALAAAAHSPARSNTNLDVTDFIPESGECSIRPTYSGGGGETETTTVIHKASSTPGRWWTDPQRAAPPLISAVLRAISSPVRESTSFCMVLACVCVTRVRASIVSCWRSTNLHRERLPWSRARERRGKSSSRRVMFGMRCRRENSNPVALS